MRSTLVAALLGAALVVVVLAPTPSGGTPRTANATAAPGPQSARIVYHAETGEVSFIGTVADAPIARPSGLEPFAAPTTVARAFLDRYGAGFGIRDQARELRVTSVEQAPAGREVVRFQQVYEGVPVLGGELVVNLDANGNLLSLGGEALPAIDTAVAPQVTPLVARETARTAVADARGIDPAGLRAGEPSLWIHDSRLMGGPGLDTPTLVWRMDVTGARGEPIDELVLVDAHLGDVVLHFDQVERVKNRQVCDAGNVYTQVPCTAPVRIEGGPVSPVPDVNDAYDLAGDTYDFFSGTLGRDGIDGAGMILKSTTRWCPPALWFEPCPWDNAGWFAGSLDQMVYGEGYARADDVVGHELTHGVTHYSSDLFSYYQSGSINESLSDVFGEYIDLTNGKGMDTAETRWQIGEDLPAAVGVLRDMENPTLFGDPDRMSSPNYWTDDDDQGGIHHNSGVNNKAAFLIADGETFNGRTVTGLGIAKAAKIYYEANTHLLTRASSYADLASALQQACANLVGTGGITSANCVEVADAVVAVEMALPRTDPPSPAAHPGKPGAVVATAGSASGSASLNWAAPASDGGSPITAYAVTSYVGGVAQTTRWFGSATSATFTGLSAGATYTFTVRASNSVDVGPASAASNPVTVKANQTISFGFLPSRTYLDVDFAVSATASSGLPVTFASSGSCTVGGSTVHITGAGSCTLTASQGGSTAYNAAPSVSQSFSIARASQTISFGSLPGRTSGDADFSVSANASSGLPVFFTASGACTVAGMSVHLTGSGTCTLTASQGGDAKYNPAPSVSRAFAIAQPKRPALKIVCRVPKVTGKLLSSAKTTITKNHCRTGTVKYAYSKKITKGKVVTQSRTAGRVLAANTKINLVVSRGVEPKKR